MSELRIRPQLVKGSVLDVVHIHPEGKKKEDCSPVHHTWYWWIAWWIFANWWWML